MKLPSIAPPDSRLNLVDIELPTFQVRHGLAHGTVTLHVSGNGDMAAIQPLNHYLSALHREALRAQCRSVQLDLTELYFLNSSCLKALLTWVNTVADETPTPYGVHFVTAPQAHWQRRSLEALRRLAPQVVTVA